MTKKEWISNCYIHDEDDPPSCHFCDVVAKDDYEIAIAETPFNGIYCCDKQECTIELGEMCKESYFTLEEVDC